MGITLCDRVLRYAKLAKVFPDAAAIIERVRTVRVRTVAVVVATSPAGDEHPGASGAAGQAEHAGGHDGPLNLLGTPVDAGGARPQVVVPGLGLPAQ
jgi:hypothetical protein